MTQVAQGLQSLRPLALSSSGRSCIRSLSLLELRFCTGREEKTSTVVKPDCSPYGVVSSTRIRWRILCVVVDVPIARPKHDSYNYDYEHDIDYNQGMHDPGLPGCCLRVRRYRGRSRCSLVMIPRLSRAVSFRWRGSPDLCTRAPSLAVSDAWCALCSLHPQAVQGHG